MNVRQRKYPTLWINPFCLKFSIFKRHNFRNNIKNTREGAEKCSIVFEEMLPISISMSFFWLHLRRNLTGQSQEWIWMPQKLRILDFVMNMNNLEGEDYSLMGGMAMGTRITPSLARFVMGELKEKFVHTYPIWSLIWIRFLDVVFRIWQGSEESLI